MSSFKTLYWEDDSLVLLDCTKLPGEESYVRCRDHLFLAECIKSLVVRGAPAIGVAAAYGVVLAAIEGDQESLDDKSYMDYVLSAIDTLSKTRPTAVNLFWALDIMEKELLAKKDKPRELIIKDLLELANSLYRDDIAINKKIGFFGNQLVLPNSNILTHCNAGALATADYGTALGVVRAAHEDNKNIHVYVDETRPLLQGSRMTAWELSKDAIPMTLIADNMAGYLMKLGRIDMLVFGADRIAANGDVANKIGSYSISVLAKEHKIPVYVAAPLSTIDKELESGDLIPIEERDDLELKELYGVQTAPYEVKVFNPAFDVTPNYLISGIITEIGVLRPPFKLSIEEALKNELV